MTDSLADLQPIYVVDTNALIWYLTAHPRLGSKAKSIFEAAKRGETRLVISAITVAELYSVLKKAEMLDEYARMMPHHAR